MMGKEVRERWTRMVGGCQHASYGKRDASNGRTMCMCRGLGTTMGQAMGPAGSAERVGIIAKRVALLFLRDGLRRGTAWLRTL